MADYRFSSRHGWNAAMCDDPDCAYCNSVHGDRRVELLRGASATRPQALPSPAVADSVEPAEDILGMEDGATDGDAVSVKRDSVEPLDREELDNLIERITDPKALHPANYRRLLATARAGMEDRERLDWWLDGSDSFSNREELDYERNKLKPENRDPLPDAARRNTGEGR